MADTDHDATAAVYCRPGCSLSCPAPAWAWLLSDRDPWPPALRLWWALVRPVVAGQEPPLAEEHWREAFEAFERAYGAAELVAGLRRAAAFPPQPAAGWTVERRGRVVLLLERYERTLREVA